MWEHVNHVFETTAVQELNDTLSGVNVSNAATLSPHFNTVTAGDFYRLDKDGNALMNLN